MAKKITDKSLIGSKSDEKIEYINECVREVCINGADLNNYEKMIGKLFPNEENFYMKVSAFITECGKLSSRSSISATSIANLTYLAREIYVTDDTVKDITRFAEQELQKRKKEAEQERRRREDERKAEEERKRREDERKAEEERKRREDERKAKEERRRREAERKAEEERKHREAQRKAEEERKRREAKRKAEEERKRREAERKTEEEVLNAEIKREGYKILLAIGILICLGIGDNENPALAAILFIALMLFYFIKIKKS